MSSGILLDARNQRRFATAADIMAGARRRVPRFAYDYLEAGIGDETCLRRNRTALDAIEIVPRYGIDVSNQSTATKLFNRTYSLPLGISPMGMAGLVWPNADIHLATAAEQANIPFVLSIVANIDVERATSIAPNSAWLQLYTVPLDDHRVTLNMVARAARAGVRALVLTVDTPRRQKRLRDLRNSLSVPFRPGVRTVWDAAAAPAWAMEILRHGTPAFANFAPYVSGASTPANLAGFVNQHMTGPATWGLVKRVRDIWGGPLVLKGILHIHDALQAAELGADGIIISNHGGRQFDAAPAPIGLVGSFRKQLPGHVAVMLDGSIHGGLDILRAMVCGADFVFAGRPFLAAVAALGESGGRHVATMFKSELSGVMAQAGLQSVSDAGSATYRTSHLESFERGGWVVK